MIPKDLDLYECFPRLLFFNVTCGYNNIGCWKEELDFS